MVVFTVLSLALTYRLITGGRQSHTHTQTRSVGTHTRCWDSTLASVLPTTHIKRIRADRLTALPACHLRLEVPGLGRRVRISDDGEGARSSGGRRSSVDSTDPDYRRSIVVGPSPN